MRYLIEMFCAIQLIFSVNVYAQENIIENVKVQGKIGLTQVPIVQLAVKVTKPLELNIAIQNMRTWKTVSRSRNLIESSNDYYVEMPIKDIVPGRYRIDAYLSPKGKDFTGRLADPVHAQMLVINEPTFEIPLKLSGEDKVKQVQFPKVVIGAQEVTLTLKYDVKGARDLRVRLLSSVNWKEFGTLKFPIKESGEMSVPLLNMIDDFPAGKYAWVVTLTEPGKTEELAKMGKHFELISE